ncbi:MAG: lactate permease LctP family transporter [Steroidobacteraceae bacterium]|nr:lactate permease LctP family transporter [Steroidobacteraceae bacterium]
MWDQIYLPIAGSLPLSAACASLPIVVLLIALAVLRMAAWKAGLLGLAAAALVAITLYDMPVALVLNASAYGAAFGLFPIAWIVFWAVALYRLTVETGQFEIIKDSVGRLTQDRRMQALLIAFAFGAFIEGAAGFGTPVAVAAAMLTGLGFSPFYAAAICLIANTAPVAFGAIGTPLVTLAGVTGLPLSVLSAEVGRICAPVSLFIPAYLMVVMGGPGTLRHVWPGALVCGVCFALTQFLISRYVGPYLTDILASLITILGLVALLHFWRPKDAPAVATDTSRIPPRVLLRAWAPYILLVVFVLLWGYGPFKALLDKATLVFAWPGLDGEVRRLPPVVPEPAAYPATFTFAILSASGTSALFATVFSAVVLGVPVGRLLSIIGRTARDLVFPILTIAAVLALAYVMNYSGNTATLGLAFAATGALFPFFSPLLGWLGVFLTGSDTSANALFGNLQVVTANTLGFPPELMAASNSSGGVMGKMISLQSISVAAAATGMTAAEEAKLFRFTLKHSILLAAVIGLIVVVYAYL